MPRRPESWVSLYNLRMKLFGILRSSAILGSDSPQSNNRKDHSLWVTPFIPRERPNVKHAIAGYLRLPQPTSAPALMRVLHWLRCWAEEPGYATGNPPEDYATGRQTLECDGKVLKDDEKVLMGNGEVLKANREELIRTGYCWRAKKRHSSETNMPRPVARGGGGGGPTRVLI